MKYRTWPFGNSQTLKKRCTCWSSHYHWQTLSLSSSVPGKLKQTRLYEIRFRWRFFSSSSLKGSTLARTGFRPTSPASYGQQHQAGLDLFVAQLCPCDDILGPLVEIGSSGLSRGRKFRFSTLFSTHSSRRKRLVLVEFSWGLEVKMNKNNKRISCHRTKSQTKFDPQTPHASHDTAA